MDTTNKLDPETTRAELVREIRRNLSAGRELLWGKLESERRQKGVPAALSYLRSYLEEASQAVRSELDALRREVRPGG